MRYSVGDKVRVRKDLEVGKDYGKDYNFNDNMAEMRGKTFTINKKYDDCYLLKETSYWWTDEMLEPVEDIIEYKGKKYGVVAESFNTFYKRTNLILEEIKEEILDETEKKYLRNVIKYVIEPTHNEVMNICKSIDNYNNKYFIHFDFNDELIVTLPYFKDKRMYKGMELDKEYTLEDLGIGDK